jgi:hypothetical protein
MAKVSMKARNEVLNQYIAKYRKASKKEKGGILNIVCGSTGLSRDRAARILSAHTKGKPPPKHTGKRGRNRIYDFPVVKALREMWANLDFACGKRLHEGIGDMLDALIRFNEVDYGKETVLKLRQMSAATMDRLLKKDKEDLRLRGISTTKPGTLLKRDIPIRLGQEWDDAVPGFVEIDLIAHCGSTSAGEYVNTLNVTDICTGWTETIAVLNKAQRHVFAGLMDIEKRQPFPFAGIDSDNGSEFINDQLYRYCKDREICFTRSRPYTKNDSCHVEQKNWSLVRRHIGYGRYFFLPSTKLIEKQRNGAHVWKLYEKPLTPYKRVLAQSSIPDAVKMKLMEFFLSINPAELNRGMMRIKDDIQKLCIKD